METYILFLGLVALTALTVLVIAGTGLALLGVWRAGKDIF